MSEQIHRSTSKGGLDTESFPMRLFQKAKKLGTWDPYDIDLSQDRKDWLNFTPEQQKALLHLTANFLGGEEAVTLDLLPLIMTIAKEGRLEEEIFLTSFLWEEAKHVEAFSRFIREVAHTDDDLSHFYGSNYKSIFYEALPNALNALSTDSSPIAQARASVTYNMIVEGTLAETGYHGYLTILERDNLMPGMRKILAYLNRNESRHIAYGVYLLSRLVAEHGDPVWETIQTEMSSLLMPTMGIVEEIFASYDPFPFEDISVDIFTNYAMGQFQKRFARIEKARNQNISQLNASDQESTFFAQTV